MRESGHITHVDSPYIVPRGSKSDGGDMNMQRQSARLVPACVLPGAQFIPLAHFKQKNKTNEPRHHLINSVLLSSKIWHHVVLTVHLINANGSSTNEMCALAIN